MDPALLLLPSLRAAAAQKSTQPLADTCKDVDFPEMVRVTSLSEEVLKLDRFALRKGVMQSKGCLFRRIQSE